MELFTKFDGRISRKGFWMGFLGIVAVLLVAGSLMISALPAGIMLTLVQVILSLGILYIWSAVLVKRLHDRDKAALPWLIIFLAPGVLSQIMSIFKIGYKPMELAGAEFMVPGIGAMVMMWVSMAVALWMIVELGFLKGTSGENSYGPDPLAAAAAGKMQAN